MPILILEKDTTSMLLLMIILFMFNFENLFPLYDHIQKHDLH